MFHTEICPKGLKLSMIETCCTTCFPVLSFWACFQAEIALDLFRYSVTVKFYQLQTYIDM